jgi:hypothetical protein
MSTVTCSAAIQWRSIFPALAARTRSATEPVKHTSPNAAARKSPVLDRGASTGDGVANAAQ